jgi:cell division septum initiation protein DivIVA
MPEDSLKEAIEATRRAAKDLASATAKLAKQMIQKADSAAQHPPESARKVVDRVAKELEAAANEVDRIIRDL